MVRVYRTIIAVGLGISIMLGGIFSYSVAGDDTFPRKANYYLNWYIPDNEVTKLAQWDLLILDMETQIASPGNLKKIRQLNPDIKLFVYITPQDIMTNAATVGSQLRKKLFNQLSPNWYLTKSGGARVSSWPGTEMLNISDLAPIVGGKRYNQFLAEFVSQELLSTGYWDGVFYDNAWDGLMWFGGPNFDLNKDGVNESDPDSHWQAGFKFLYNETRRLTNGKYDIIGNGGSKAYRDELNGLMLESFPNYGGWKGTMDIYSFYEAGGRTPKVMVINRNTLNKGTQNNYRSMRYGLASALMGDGYYSFDHGDQLHEQTWWYDEYDVNLGVPTGAPTSLSGKPKYQEDVWRRDFSNGLAIVNATKLPQEIDLGGEYEKIIGKQDPAINDGAIVNKINLQGEDGILMFKTFRTLTNVFFKNGSFVRFFKTNGTRARNGFFAFEEGYPGGARIYNGDLDGDGTPEKIVVNGPKLEIFNSQGQRWLDEYPFGPNIKGNLSIAVGRLGAEKESHIAVASSNGGQIILYTYYGSVVKSEVYPLGKAYKNGFSVAIGNIDGGAKSEIILGTGGGRAAEVLVYDDVLGKIKKRFYPFDRKYLGGVNVTAGDFNGDGKEEIAAVSTSGTKPLVRLFDGAAKKFAEFPIKGFFGVQTMTLGAADVNFEGLKEIVSMSDN